MQFVFTSNLIIHCVGKYRNGPKQRYRNGPGICNGVKGATAVSSVRAVAVFTHTQSFRFIFS